MTPDNRAGQGLVKGDVTPAILFGRVDRRSAADPGERIRPPAAGFPRGDAPAVWEPRNRPIPIRRADRI